MTDPLDNLSDAKLFITTHEGNIVICDEMGRIVEGLISVTATSSAEHHRNEVTVTMYADVWDG